MFVGLENRGEMLFKRHGQTNGHRVDPRLLVRVVVLRVLDDEAHVLRKVRRRRVVADLQLLAYRLQVHRVVDEARVVGELLQVDGRPERLRVLGVADHLEQLLALLLPTQSRRRGEPSRQALVLRLVAVRLRRRALAARVRAVRRALPAPRPHVRRVGRAGPVPSRPARPRLVRLARLVPLGDLVVDRHGVVRLLVPDDLQTELAHDLGVLHDVRRRVVERARVRVDEAHVELHGGDAMVEPVLQARLDRGQIQRVGDGQGVSRVHVQINGSRKRLGDGQTHDLTDGVGDPVALGVALAAPVFRRRPVQDVGRLLGRDGHPRAGRRGRPRRVDALEVPRAHAVLVAVRPPDLVALEHGLGQLGVERLAGLELALPPQVVDERPEPVAGLPVALDGRLVRLTVHEEVEHVRHVVILDDERFSRECPAYRINQAQLFVD